MAWYSRSLPIWCLALIIRWAHVRPVRDSVRCWASMRIWWCPIKACLSTKEPWFAGKVRWWGNGWKTLSWRARNITFRSTVRITTWHRKRKICCGMGREVYTASTIFLSSWKRIFIRYNTGWCKPAIGERRLARFVRGAAWGRKRCMCKWVVRISPSWWRCRFRRQRLSLINWNWTRRMRRSLNVCSRKSIIACNSCWMWGWVIWL